MTFFVQIVILDTITEMFTLVWVVTAKGAGKTRFYKLARQIGLFV